MKTHYNHFRLNMLRKDRHILLNRGFKCIYCLQIVCEETILSNVHNRNHCPYCLWSKHIDLYQPGDRLAACKSRMQPIGLTLKRQTKKYADGSQGELMLIHKCVECGKLSINRIAADDNIQAIFEIFESSLGLDQQTEAQLHGNGIKALKAYDIYTVRSQLLGRN